MVSESIGDLGPQIEAVGQVAFMQMNGHAACLVRKRKRGGLK